MDIQKTKWGQILWDRTLMGNEYMNVGIVTMEVGACIPPHTHYTEQVLVVFEGELISISDGVQTHCRKGDVLHYPSGVIHEACHVGEIPTKHLLVSNPNSIKIEIPVPQFLNTSEAHVSPEETRQLFEQAIRSVKHQYLETLIFPYAIYNAEGTLVEESHRKCMTQCKFHSSNLACQGASVGNDSKTEFVFICNHTYKIINVPIFLPDNLLDIYKVGIFIKMKINHRKAIKMIHHKVHKLR